MLFVDLGFGLGGCILNSRFPVKTQISMGQKHTSQANGLLCNAEVMCEAESQIDQLGLSVI